MTANNQNTSSDQSVSDQEQMLLLAVCALISSANSAASENGGGFRFVPEGLSVEWPEPVQSAIGLKQSASIVVDEREHMFRVLFTPTDDDGRTTYWSRLFGQVRPSLVIEYNVSEGDDQLVQSTYENWLVWDWHKNAEDWGNAVHAASDTQALLESEIDWLNATRKSVEERRSILFDAVAAHVAGSNL